ncbi:hypothetical protein ZWY2020_015371 [Hordeum vulgare]|nr:hypothetical protein ZWY2020_015371 [Hordeum vulgare]
MAVFLLVALSTSHIASSLRPSLGVCRASGYLPGKLGNCKKSNDPDCCEDGKRYPQYHCSPPVTATTKAVLTLNSFEKGKGGGGPSECDNAYHSDEEMVVALSTGWFKNMARCGHRIRVTANGKSVHRINLPPGGALHLPHRPSPLRSRAWRSGYLPGKSGNCEKSNDPDCCEDGKRYPQYHCSPPVTATTKAVLTLNSFEKGKDGGGPSECDNAYHSDEEMVVALSTGWFKNMARQGTASGRALGEHGSGEGELCVLCHACRSKAEAGAEAITKKQKRITVQHCSVAKMASARALATVINLPPVVLSTSHIASSLRRSRRLPKAAIFQENRATVRRAMTPSLRGWQEIPAVPPPPVTATTKAVLTLNSFEKGKDGGGPSECDNAYHSDEEMVVALSTGWFKNMAR